MEVSLKEKMEVIENHRGGGRQAAEAAKVTHTSWSRWKAGKPEPTEPHRALIDLLYKEAIAALERDKAANE